MTGPTPHVRNWDRPALLALVVAIGFVLRAIAAVVVQQYVERKGPDRLCVFPDTRVYWMLAGTIRAGEPFRVMQWDVPHDALRTPGYPLFLAACQVVFGGGINLLPVRLVQAALGAGCAWLVARLVRQVWPDESERTRGALPMGAAVLAAVEPYTVGLSVLVLSEALFVPLMLATLWGMAGLWPSARDRPGRAIGTGLLAGSALLVRPSWALFIPMMLSVWVLAAGAGRRIGAVKGAVWVVVGIVVVMGPWWVRNARIYGRFVPTALWEGPSLYDGLNPEATGASNMRFVDEPENRRLDEETLDQTLHDRAWAFARENPGRVVQLAAIKAGRFWSPWPNAENLNAPMVALGSALVTLPVYLLVLVGGWDRRRELRALVLLAGSLLYFWALHMLFVGSVRYRIPGLVPAFGLASLGAGRLWGLWAGRGGER